MKLAASLALGCLWALDTCAESSPDEQDKCTARALESETGAGQLHADVLVPREFTSGAEISNGGIVLLTPGCDYALNAFLSRETADYIIAQAPLQTLTKSGIDLRLVEGEFFVWKFRDGSGEPRFFIMSVNELSAIKEARTADEARRFTMPESAS
jgi:hypothetical protein